MTEAALVPDRLRAAAIWDAGSQGKDSSSSDSSKRTPEIEDELGTHKPQMLVTQANADV
ncbi:MAG TPA: hypothetical protein VGC77_14555 [Rhodopseudomonas sp.]|uniref:hypothetical protein n=1 Tax=Rhodopseudomonas sp. TaxID=1078 RepID=UPI002ED979F9